MLDIKFIRENSEEVKKALENRGVTFDVVDKILKVDEERRSKIKKVDGLRAQQNQFVGEIAQLTSDKKQEKIKESREIKGQLGEAETELKLIDEELTLLMRKLPNIPHPGVPIGKDERSNKVVREVGDKPHFDFPPRDYLEIADALDLIDITRAAKVSGSRFGYIKNELAFLEFALIQLALEKTRAHGFSPVIPPVLIKEEIMRGMGYIDSEKDLLERYFLPDDKQFLVGTSEQSIVPMHADEMLDVEKLPLRYAGFSSCFRREAGSYGKDTHGILRVHQFDKVEMVIFAGHEDSSKEHALLLQIEEELMQALQIPYRVVQSCTGDLSHPSAATYDIEAWLPGQRDGKGEYRETHSCSNTTDFQARRLNIRYKPETQSPEAKPKFVHILNGTTFAIGRTIIAIIENYQKKDGSIQIPKILQPYMAGITTINHSP